MKAMGYGQEVITKIEHSETTLSWTSFKSGLSTGTRNWDLTTVKVNNAGYADNAGHANNATNDINNDPIDTTYARKDEPLFSASAGDSETAVYFASGKPVACNYHTTTSRCFFHGIRMEDNAKISGLKQYEVMNGHEVSLSGTFLFGQFAIVWTGSTQGILIPRSATKGYFWGYSSVASTTGGRIDLIDQELGFRYVYYTKY